MAPMKHVANRPDIALTVSTLDIQMTGLLHSPEGDAQIGTGKSKNWLTSSKVGKIKHKFPPVKTPLKQLGGAIIGYTFG